MELWVRSQDKTRLGKIELIEYQEDDYGFYLFGWNDKFEGTRLATYKTKERALEVLDEIQHILNPIVDRKILEIEQKDLLNGTNFIQPKLKDIEISEFNTYVYEMPKE